MDAIKFRLILNGKIVGYEKWYPGHWHKSQAAWTADPQWLYSSDGKRWNPKPIFHTSKDQFTGLKEKNSIEIYARDVINDEGLRLVIEWDPFAYAWVAAIDKKIELLARFNPTRLEVIGNIHENPELVANQGAPL